MRPSPLKLNSLRFLHVSVYPRNEPETLDPVENPAPIDTWGANIHCSLTHAEADKEEGGEVRDYMVALGIQVSDGPEKVVPYKIDVECVGYFSIPNGFPDAAERLEIAVVNGASLLYGAIREQVATVTSRCWYGELRLPSLNFREDGPAARAAAEAKRRAAEEKNDATQPSADPE